MATQTVGFVGLGIMGLPMAENLLDAGYTVYGHNRSRGPVDDLVEAGGERAETAREATARSDVTITCLPDTETVENVLYGDDGVLEAVDGDTVVIDMSTISPTATERFAEDIAAAGGRMLDAPISGGEEGAVAGTLSIMVGGDEATLAECRDLLDVMGATITHCGPNGAGQTTKACNQMIVAGQMVAISEALVFARKAGADLEAVVEAVSGGAAACWALDNRAPQMVEGEFDPGFFAAYHYKDLRIATDAADTYGAPMLQTDVAKELYKAMEATGRGEDDTSGVMQVVEALAGDAERGE